MIISIAYYYHILTYSNIIHKNKRQRGRASLKLKKGAELLRMNKKLEDVGRPLNFYYGWISSHSGKGSITEKP